MKKFVIYKFCIEAVMNQLSLTEVLYKVITKKKFKIRYKESSVYAFF